MIPKEYIPKEGDKVKLRDATHYTSRGLPLWSWLLVTAVNGYCETKLGTRYIEKGKLPLIRLEVLNGEKRTEQFVSVKPGEIEVPLHWKPVYEIYASDREQGESILQWLADKRGVRVWGSRDLGTAGNVFYTPGDGLKPHWSVEGDEIVRDPQRIKILLIVKHPVPTGDPTGCVHVDDWKKEKREAAKVRSAALQKCRRDGHEVHNLKDGGAILESWWESFEELKLEEAKDKT